MASSARGDKCFAGEIGSFFFGSLGDYNPLSNMHDSAKRWLGIKSGSRAFTAPFKVWVDVTDACNLACIFCRTHSPLAKAQGRRNNFMEIDMFKGIVDELSSIGVKEIVFSPHGEPFAHPNFLEMAEYAAGKGLKCSIVTNGTLLDEETAKRLAGLDVELRVSLHSGDADAWKRLQGGAAVPDFKRLKRVLKILNAEESLASVDLYGVVTSANYMDVAGIYKLAAETKTGRVVLQPFVRFGGGEKLALTAAQSEELKSGLEDARKLAAQNGIKDNIDELLHDRAFSRDGVFDYDLENSFDDRIPCRVGWFYSRIDVSGNVLACPHGASVGSIRNEGFEEIWKSKEYAAARREMAAAFKNPEAGGKYPCRLCCFIELNRKVEQASIANILRRLLRI
ncbi:MAG: radical SAM protein [Candidatus Altiarchaeota archaeon]